MHITLYIGCMWKQLEDYTFFLQNIFICTKRKKINHVHVRIFLNPKYWELSWGIKMEFCIIEKSNNSIATKQCATLLNNRRKNKLFSAHDTIQWLKCVVHYLNVIKTKNWLRKFMHNFLVHENDIACRKSGRLGLDQVFYDVVTTFAIGRFICLIVSVFAGVSAKIFCICCCWLI